MALLKQSPFKHLTGDYKPIAPHVTGVHIGIIVVVVLLLWYFMRNGNVIGFSSVTAHIPSPAQVNPNVPTQPVTTFGAGADALNWRNIQYNALGAYAGALNGEAG